MVHGIDQCNGSAHAAYNCFLILDRTMLFDFYFESTPCMVDIEFLNLIQHLQHKGESLLKVKDTATKSTLKKRIV